MGMTLTTRMLTPETWDDFAALVEANNGVWGGCWCMGFHPEGVGPRAHPGRKPGGETSARDARNGPPGARLRRGPLRRLVPVRLAGRRCPRSRTGARTTEGQAEPPDWRIGCVFTSAKDRGQGVAAAAVAAALDEIQRAGGGVVEAYPEQTEQRPPQRGAYLHTGPEELYARYGFTRVRKIAKWRWVMRTEI